MKKTLFFGNPYHLNTKYLQLNATDKDTGEIRTVPMEDLGFIVFEHPQITFTQSVIQLLVENNVAVVFCDAKHHPCSMLLPLDTNYVQSERFKFQINATAPVKKKLWQQTIKAKINNQAALLEMFDIDAEALRYKAAKVKSGDPANEEAQVARIYWKRLFGKEFTRERYGISPNPALNYGYAILRAAVARALAGSGLLPTLGIHHRNKYNAFCLADDIMEAYRPYVDKIVVTMQKKGGNCENLGIEEKRTLLNVLSMDTVTNGNSSPLMIAITHTTASLVKCFEGKDKNLIYPHL